MGVVGSVGVRFQARLVVWRRVVGVGVVWGGKSRLGCLVVMKRVRLRLDERIASLAFGDIVYFGKIPLLGVVQLLATVSASCT